MNTPPPKIDLAALPPDVRAVVEAQQAQIAMLTELNARLEHLVKEFRRALYGKSSEKLTADERQLAFEDIEAAVAEAEAAKPSADATPKASRSKTETVKRNLGALPTHLPRIEQVVEPDSTDCPCGCGAMARIGEDRTERLDVVPAQLRVVVTVRPRYACRRCSEKVVQAPAPAHLIEGALPTEALLAHVLVSKYADHQPLYRQAQIMARGGVELDRSTLADWVGKTAFHLKPVVDALTADLKRSTKLFMDETRAPVLDPGRGKTKTGYLWALARDGLGAVGVSR
jgi:transposase